MSDNFTNPLRNNDLTILIDIFLFYVRLMAELYYGIGRETEHASLNAGIFDLTIAQAHRNFILGNIFRQVKYEDCLFILYFQLLHDSDRFVYAIMIFEMGLLRIVRYLHRVRVVLDFYISTQLLTQPIWLHPNGRICCGMKDSG